MKWGNGSYEHNRSRLLCVSILYLCRMVRFLAPAFVPGGASLVAQVVACLVFVFLVGSGQSKRATVKSVGNIVQRTVLVSTRFPGRVEVKNVSFAVVRVRFDHAVELRNYGRKTPKTKPALDGDVVPDEIELDDAFDKSAFVPEAENLPSTNQFGIAELVCGEAAKGPTVRFNSFPPAHGARQSDDALPSGFLVPRPNVYSSYPFAVKVIKMAELLNFDLGGGGDFELFPLQDGFDEEIQARYEAIIFDPYFSSPRRDCEVRFVPPKEQQWKPKLTYALPNHAHHHVVPLPAELAYFRPACDVVQDSNVAMPLPGLPKHAMAVARALSKRLGSAQVSDESGAAEDVEECVELPEEIFNVTGVTSMLQLGSMKGTSDVEEQLPGIMIPFMKIILFPIQKLMAALYGHSVEEKMFASGGMEIREGLIKEVVEQLTPKVITGVTSTVFPELIATVPDAVAESMEEILQTYLTDDLSPRTEEVFAAGLSSTLASTLTGDTAPMSSRTLTERATRAIVHSLTRSVAHSVVPALTQTIAHNPLQDYYCYYCYHKKVYCQYCVYTPSQLYYSTYYAGFYSAYYGDYFADYFSRPEDFGFIAKDDEVSHHLPGHKDPYNLDKDPNTLPHDTADAGLYKFN